MEKRELTTVWLYELGQFVNSLTLTDLLFTVWTAVGIVVLWRLIRWPR